MDSLRSELFSRDARSRVKLKHQTKFSRLYQPKKRFFRESRCEFCRFTRRHSFCQIGLRVKTSKANPQNQAKLE